MLRQFTISIASLTLPLAAVAASTPARTLKNAAETLEEISIAAPTGDGPLGNARGLGLFPRLASGKGVMVVRCRDGSWSDPVFAELSGTGVRAGSEPAILIVFKTRQSLERLFANKDAFTLGNDEDIATHAFAAGRLLTISSNGFVIRPDTITNLVFRQNASSEELTLAAGLRNLAGRIGASETGRGTVLVSTSNPTSSISAIPSAPPVTIPPPHSIPPLVVPPQPTPTSPASPGGLTIPAGKDNVEAIVGSIAAAVASMAYRWAKKKISRKSET